MRLSLFSVLWSGIVGAFAVALALGSGSLALLGFGVDAAIDAIASVVLIWRFWEESRRPHRADRVEQLAEVVVGSALVLFAVYLIVASVGAIAGGHAPSTSVPTLIILVGSLVVLPPLAFYKRRVATELGSGALIADSTLTAVSAVLAAISLIGIALTDLGLWWADASAALIVAALVLREGATTVVSAARRNGSE